MSNHNGTNGNEPPLTPVEEWQRLRLHGALTTLKASGRVVRFRPVNMTRLLKEGKVPDHLSAFVAEVVWNRASEDERTTAEQAIDWNDYLDLVVAASLISPRVCADPQGPDEIHFDDLIHSEKLEIESMARHPVEEVRRFRTEQGRDVPAGPEGREVPQSAE